MIEPSLKVVESIEMDEPETVESPPDGPSYHTLLEVWREVLAPGRTQEMRQQVIAPQWATRIVGTYTGVSFADCGDIHVLLLDLVEDLAQILDEQIASDSQALSRTEAELDATENAQHYKDLLREWQRYFLEQELAWRCTDRDAAIQLAALGEAHRLFFGQTGLTAHLDTIGFEFTEADQQELGEALEATRQAYRAREERV